MFTKSKMLVVYDQQSLRDSSKNSDVWTFGTATTFGLACVQSEPSFLRQTVASPAVVADCNRWGLVFGWDALWLWNIYGIALQTPPCGLAPTLDKVSLSCIKPSECRPTFIISFIRCEHLWFLFVELSNLWLGRENAERVVAFVIGAYDLWCMPSVLLLAFSALTVFSPSRMDRKSCLSGWEMEGSWQIDTSDPKCFQDQNGKVTLQK